MELEHLFKNENAVFLAFLATTFTWALTACGASLVFFIKGIERKIFDPILGFTGGVMIAASFWSLLSPSIEISPGSGFVKVMPSLIGFLAGGLFLFSLDKLIPHLHVNFERSEAEGPKTDWHGTTLLVLAITLHNIPEGLAVGMLFGGAAAGLQGATYEGAVALAIGIGIQNFPEGLAVAFPLRRQGISKIRCFWYGQLSAIVEPVAGVLGALLVTELQATLPYALSFAAGAMIYVVIEEVIPEFQRDKYSDRSCLGFLAGFALMMLLDVGLK